MNNYRRRDKPSVCLVVISCFINNAGFNSAGIVSQIGEDTGEGRPFPESGGEVAKARTFEVSEVLFA